LALYRLLAAAPGAAISLVDFIRGSLRDHLVGSEAIGKDGTSVSIDEGGLIRLMKR
jgi:hypothetical protein